MKTSVLLADADSLHLPLPPFIQLAASNVPTCSYFITIITYFPKTKTKLFSPIIIKFKAAYKNDLVGFARVTFRPVL